MLTDIIIIIYMAGQFRALNLNIYLSPNVCEFIKGKGLNARYVSLPVSR